MKTLVEKLTNKEQAYLAPMTYLIGKMCQTESGKKDVEHMLERVNDELFDDLKDFLGQGDFEKVPELLGDEEPNVYLKYFDDITPEELDKLVR